MTGYSSYKTVNNHNQNDGVVVYTKQQLGFVVTCPHFSEANCLLLKNDKLSIIAIYRSPSFRCLDSFLSDLNCLLSTVKVTQNILLIGDLNIDISLDNTDINKDHYLNLTSSHGLLPTYYTPTRISRCLDHALLKCNNKAVALLLECDLTDHIPAIICLNIDKISAKVNPPCFQTDFAAAVTDIMDTNFSSVMFCDNANLATDNLLKIITPILKKHTKVLKIPKKKIILKPWITPGLLRCIRHRNKLYKRYKVNSGARHS